MARASRFDIGKVIGSTLISSRIQFLDAKIVIFEKSRDKPVWGRMTGSIPAYLLLA